MANGTNNTSNRGFAKLKKEDPEKLRNIAAAGGHSSSGSFGSENGADPSEAGREGAERQPKEAKSRGGQNSHR